MTLAVPPSSRDPLVAGVDEQGAAPDVDGAVAPTLRGAVVWRRLRHQPYALGGLAFLLVAVLCAVLAPVVAPFHPNAQDLNLVNTGPTTRHWLGTDDLGRDILSRLMWGGRVSLRATFEIVGLAVVMAFPIGLVAGFFKGPVDSVIMRLMDALFSFPPLVLALTVAALLGSNLNDTALAIAIVFVPGFVRLLRGQVIAVREETYIEAARSLGARSDHLIRRHIVPNVASPMIIQVALALGFALLVEAGLSFLGVGEQPPTPSWGSMLNEGYQFIFTTPWALIFPGLAIMLSVLSFNLAADGLRDSLGRDRPRSAGPAAGEGFPGRLRARRRTRPPPVPEEGAGLVEAGPHLLQVAGLGIEFLTEGSWLRVVDAVSFSVGPGRTLGLVGESGSGKTVSALAIMGLLPARGCRSVGAVRFGGRDLMRLAPAQLRQVRGRDIGMIFQEPMTSLNPAFTVGNQIAEQVRTHRDMGRKDAWKVAVEMLDRVEIPGAARRAHDYPHAFSGGMRQRVMIAMALSCSPKLLIADEPTTALDVTTQAQIVDLLHTLQDQDEMAMIFVTHDLGVIADVADDVVVMYAGQVVERREPGQLYARPAHPYTEALLSAIPQLTPPGEPLNYIPGMVPRPDRIPTGCRFHPRCAYAVDACVATPVELRAVDPASGGDGASRSAARCLRMGELTLAGAGAALARVGPAKPPDRGPQPPLLQVENLSKTFPVRSGVLRRATGAITAVDGVDLTISPGRTLGLVGESGSGKSTLARLVGRLIEPSSGRIVMDGTDISALSGSRLRRERHALQMVFQDPYSSLDPRLDVAEIVAEPLVVHTGLDRSGRAARATEVLAQVGLGAHLLRRQPHELSGGQRQRVAIARALALNPRLLICDEPVSALDSSTQSQVINLLSGLQDRLGLAYLFIAHDLSVVRHLSDRIAVMYLGRIVEEGLADEVYLRPTHPYTAALLSAIPVPDPAVQRSRPRLVLTGEVTADQATERGCRFRRRCPLAMDICAGSEPEPFLTPTGSTVRCHLHTSGPVLSGAPVTGLTASRGGQAVPEAGGVAVQQP